MIVFDLECRNAGHRFEGWFGSSDEYADQHGRGLVTCPACGSPDVARALSAPRLARKGNRAVPAPVSKQAMAGGKLPPEALKAMQALARHQAETIKDSRWVGDGFAEAARAIHYGEREAETIHGQATRAEAVALHEEGVAVAPLLIPVAPPDEIN